MSSTTTLSSPSFKTPCRLRFTAKSAQSEKICGPSATVELLNRSHKSTPCQRCCCPADKLNFYRRVCMNVFELLVARVVVIAVATVLYYVNNGVTTVMCVVLKLTMRTRKV